MNFWSIDAFNKDKILWNLSELLNTYTLSWYHLHICFIYFSDYILDMYIVNINGILVYIYPTAAHSCSRRYIYISFSTRMWNLSFRIFPPIIVNLYTLWGPQLEIKYLICEMFIFIWYRNRIQHWVWKKSALTLKTVSNTHCIVNVTLVYLTLGNVNIWKSSYHSDNFFLYTHVECNIQSIIIKTS